MIEEDALVVKEEDEGGTAWQGMALSVIVVESISPERLTFPPTQATFGRCHSMWPQAWLPEELRCSWSRAYLKRCEDPACISCGGQSG